MILDGDSYRRILDNLYDGLYLVSADRVIQYWNGAAEQISGFSASEVVGKSCSDNILTHVNETGDSLCKGRCPVAMTVHDGKSREAEVFLHHKDGHRVPVSVRVTAVTDETGRIIGAAELFSDISNAKVSEMKIKEPEEMALLDNLTKIANRNYIEKDIAACFEQRKLRVSMSIGATLVRDDDDRETLLKRADTLLYESKKAGRNCLTLG